MNTRDSPVRPCDVRFGIEGSPVVVDPLSTAEVRLNKWRVTRKDTTGLDMSLRLGRALTRLPSSTSDFTAYTQALREYRRLVEPAVATGVLTALVLEFHPSFSYCPEARRHLDRVLDDLSGLPLVVAFFNPEWYSSRVIERLKVLNVALCLMDTPRCPASPPAVDVVTAPLVYVKFYGRNLQAWEQCLGRVLFDYDYSEHELLSWLPRLDALSAQAERLRVIFANTRNGTAERNARRLTELWQERR